MHRKLWTSSFALHTAQCKSSLNLHRTVPLCLTKSTMAPSTIHTLIFGGLGLVSVSFLVYFMFWRKPSTSGVKAIKDKDADTSADKPLKQVEKKFESHTDKSSTGNVKKAEPTRAPSPQFVVEDADSDEEEEEEAEAEVTTVDNELEELQTKYDDANRLAKKLIAGESYEKAVVKLTEALELAPRIPGAGKDIMTLYNNRSAMYEKIGQYEKSLSDITVILAMDPFHAKARVRRARIFEAQVSVLFSQQRHRIVHWLTLSFNPFSLML